MNVCGRGNKPGSNINLVRRPKSFSIILSIYNPKPLLCTDASFAGSDSSKLDVARKERMWEGREAT